MTCIDFNLIVYHYGPEFLIGAKHEPRTNCFLTTHGLFSSAAFQIVRRSISRRPSHPNVYLSRSVLLYGFRAAYGSRESARYRSLSARRRAQALSRRYEGESLAQHFGQSQRSTQLENLSQHRSDSDRSGPHALRPSTLGQESQTRGLRSGFHCRRFVPDALSLGHSIAVTKAPSRCMPNWT
jgi:hypothetical protein